MKQNKEKKLLLFNDTSYQCAHIDKNERIESSAVGIYLRIPPSCSGRQLDNQAFFPFRATVSKVVQST